MGWRRIKINPSPFSIMNDPLQQVREIVMKYGWNAVAYQILNPGFLHWFSEDGNAVAGYVKRSGRWIIAGGPVCDRVELPKVIEQLEGAARADGCRVCYFGAAVRLYDGCKNPPKHTIVALGSQPCWDPRHWFELTRKHASVRAQFQRALNKGVRIEECNSPLPTQISDLQKVLDRWIKARSMPPMHFLVEPDTLTFLQDRRVFIAKIKGELCGFLIASPVPCRQGWLVEQIIRDPEAPNGTNELLLDNAMQSFAREESGYVTLGLVPLSIHVPPLDHKNPPWLSLLFRWLKAHGRRFYDFEGLEAFKSKFSPEEWEPIYAISTEARFSPKTLWAIAAAFSHRKSPVIHGSKALAMAMQSELNHVRKLLTR